MKENSLRNAFPQRLQQEADVRHVLHHPLGGAAVTGVEVAHRGGEQHVVERFGKLLGTDDAERAQQLGQVVLFLHGSALLSVKFCKLEGKLAFLTLYEAVEKIKAPLRLFPVCFRTGQLRTMPLFCTIYELIH